MIGHVINRSFTESNHTDASKCLLHFTIALNNAFSVGEHKVETYK